jgi:hypothetical protein
MDDWLLLGVLFALPIVPTFWAIVHVLTKAHFENPLKRFAWLGVVTLLPVLGALAYIVVRPGKAPSPGQPPSSP